MTFDSSNSDPGAKLNDAVSDGKLGSIGVDKDSVTWIDSFSKWKFDVLQILSSTILNIFIYTHVSYVITRLVLDILYRIVKCSFTTSCTSFFTPCFTSYSIDTEFSLNAKTPCYPTPLFIWCFTSYFTILGYFLQYCTPYISILHSDVDLAKIVHSSLFQVNLSRRPRKIRSLFWPLFSASSLVWLSYSSEQLA